MKLSAVNRCQVLISESLGKMPVYCIDRDRRRVDHDLLRLLNIRPNEAMTPSVERQMVEGNRLSGGNGYEWIIRDPRTGRPVELIPLPWELVHPFRDRNGVIWYGVSHPTTGEPMVLSNQDVLHYKAYTHDGILGISVLRRASEVVNAGRAAQQYEASYFANGGHPDGILYTDTDLSGTVKRTKGDIGFEAGDEGYLDLYGLRKTTALDFSGWDSGTFKETVEGIAEPYSYKVEFDVQGRPVKITDDNGHEMAVMW